MSGTISLRWLDYVVMAAFLCVSLGIGIYHSLSGGRQRTTSEFISGNRRLSVIPTAVSLFVSFVSAIALLGGMTEFYQYGLMFFVWAPPSFVVALVVTERLIIPWLYPLRLVSINGVSIIPFSFCVTPSGGSSHNKKLS